MSDQWKIALCNVQFVIQSLVSGIVFVLSHEDSKSPSSLRNSKHELESVNCCKFERVRPRFKPKREAIKLLTTKDQQIKKQYYKIVQPKISVEVVQMKCSRLLGSPTQPHYLYMIKFRNRRTNKN